MRLNVCSFVIVIIIIKYTWTDTFTKDKFHPSPTLIQSADILLNRPACILALPIIIITTSYHRLPLLPLPSH